MLEMTRDRNAPKQVLFEFRVLWGLIVLLVDDLKPTWDHDVQVMDTLIAMFVGPSTSPLIDPANCPK